MNLRIFIRIYLLTSIALGFFSCEHASEKKSSYELDWVASEIQQDGDYDFEAQSLDILTLRLINHDKKLLGILVQESFHEGPFYLFHEDRSSNYCNLSIVNFQNSTFSDTTFIYVSSSTNHPRYVKDEEVAQLIQGRLYYWPDPKFVKPGVLADSIEIKKVANFHSATCQSGKPLYRKLYPNK